MKQTRKRFILSIVTICLVLTTGLTLYSKVHAADNNLTDGITVDSTLDTADASVGDGICDDGDGNCTLRAAIEEANSDPDVSTINFNITGTADFTNQGEDGYTIAPASALPAITETATINGYSQPGSEANTAVAPNPLNGILLIEIDGSAISGVTGIEAVANGTIIRGLVLGGFNNNNQRTIAMAADDIIIQGNYIGTDPTGLSARPNFFGIPIGLDDSDNALIGGLDAEDRNLISGNLDSAVTPNGNSDNWTIQGNYIGVDKTGLVGLPNNTNGSGAGALSLDNSEGHVIGGSQPHAINVISGNAGHGIAPHGTLDILIENNYIGVGYDGVTSLGNGSGGEGASIYFSSSSAMVIRDNIVQGGAAGGVTIGSDCSDGQISENTVYDNYMTNISIIGLSLIGEPSDNFTITGNKVGYNIHSQPTYSNQVGIGIIGDPSNVQIGGVEASERNKIINSTGDGIALRGLYVNAFSAGTYPVNVSILGNSIHNSSSGTTALGPGAGLGIDLYTGVDTSGPPDGIPDEYENTGPTPNDSSDSDTGPNNYINFPVLNSASQNGNQATFNFNLDATDSPTDQYRIEFFSNDSADPSGYGEGQTFLGSTTVSNGTNQQATITLPSGTNLTNKHISATTTAIDNTTDSGFGSTSEFSAVLSGIGVSGLGTGTSSNADSLAGTGQSAILYVYLSVLLTLASPMLITIYKRATLKT